MICAGCKQTIQANEPSISFSYGPLKYGQKRQGWYVSPDNETPIICHYQCIFTVFNPLSDKEMYDYFYNRVINQVRQEEFDQLKENAYDEAADALDHLCPECRRDRQGVLEKDMPPEEEYECPGCGAASLPICQNCGETVDVVNAPPIEEEDTREGP